MKNKSWEDSEPVLLRYVTGLRRRVRGDYLEIGEQQEDMGVDPDPEDINPQHEDPDDLEAAQPPLDSSDDEASDDELTTLEDAMPDNFEVAPMPTEEQLAFRSESAESVVGLGIIVNWAGVGWIRGTITTANQDGRRKVQGYRKRVACFGAGIR